MTKTESKYFPCKLRQEVEYDFGNGRTEHKPKVVGAHLDEPNQPYPHIVRTWAIQDTCRGCEVKKECRPEITYPPTGVRFRVRGNKITDEENCRLRNPGISEETYLKYYNPTLSMESD